MQVPSMVRPLSQPSFLLFAALVVSTRVWLVDSGFGADSDAWRVANSGDWLARTGDYVISRRPGYPLTEFVSAFLLWAEKLLSWPGWRLMNVVTLGVFLAQCQAFARLNRRYEVVWPAGMVAAYSLHPTVFDHSMGSLDMHLPLLLVLLAWQRASNAHSLQAGVLFGLATAARFSFVTFAFALAYLCRRHEGGSGMSRFIGSSLAMALPFYAVVLRQTGTRVAPDVPSLDSLGAFTKAWVNHGVFEALGPIAFVALILVLWYSRESLAAGLASPDGKSWTLALVPVITLFVLQPWEAVYLVPAFPFALIFLGRHANRKLLRLFLIVWVLNGYVSVPAKSRISDYGRTQVHAVGMGDWFRLMEQRSRKLELLEGLGHANATSGEVVLLEDAMPVLWFHWRLHLSDSNEVGIVGSRISNFNNPLHDRIADVYYAPSWADSIRGWLLPDDRERVRYDLRTQSLLPSQP